MPTILVGTVSPEGKTNLGAYSGTVSSGKIKSVSDLAASVDGRDVIIIEDIVDTGRTLAGLKRLLYSRGAKSVACVVLADKPSRRARSQKKNTLPLSTQTASGIDCAAEYFLSSQSAAPFTFSAMGCLRSPRRQAVAQGN